MREASKPGSPVAGGDDLSLVSRVLGGDRGAFETLVRRHERRVFRVTLAVAGNREDAEEAMQDTFIKAFRRLDQFRQEARFTTWLTRIAINEALQRLRRQKGDMSLDDMPNQNVPIRPQRFEPWRADPEKLYGKQEVRRLVETAIQSLPAIYREAFVLRDVEEMSVEEAAEALGISIPAVKSRLLRARLMLREALAPSFEKPPSLRTRIVHTATDMKTAVAMRLMRAAGR